MALGKGINSDEAAALGLVYMAAYHTPGFRVKRFVVKEINQYPISVSISFTRAFQRLSKTIYFIRIDSTIIIIYSV